MRVRRKKVTRWRNVLCVDPMSSEKVICAHYVKAEAEEPEEQAATEEPAEQAAMEEPAERTAREEPAEQMATVEQAATAEVVLIMMWEAVLDKRRTTQLKR